MTDNRFTARRALWLRQQQRQRRRIRAWQLGLLLALFGLWELTTALGLVDGFVISSPSRMLTSFLSLCRGGSLLEHIGISCLETVLGFLAGTLLGCAVAVAMWWWEGLARVLSPYLVVLNALPKIALGPVLIVWIGAGMESIIVMAVLISLIVTAVTILGGFTATTGEKELLMRTLGATKFQIFKKVVLPASVPDMISALKISVGMSWVGVIVGEYLVSKAGLGYLIVYGGQVFRLDLVMASVVLLCVLAALMYAAVALLEQRIRRRF